ncbi:MAG: hypothetical protein R3B70_20660 [Polyangiaceae bacterium]
MSAPVVDLARVRAALRRLDTLAGQHPELATEAARERCDAWIEGEEPDDGAEPDPPAERRAKRPASRGE